MATEIYGAIEAVLVDEIRPAIEYLEAASRVTAEELRERHREEAALLRRFRGRI